MERDFTTNFETKISTKMTNMKYLIPEEIGGSVSESIMVEKMFISVLGRK